MTSSFFPASPVEIRDGTWQRIVALGIFRKVYKGRVAPTQDEQLPLCCVWNAGERTQQIGDANVGAPEFLHTLTLAIDVMATGVTEGGLDLDIVETIEKIRATLLTDPSWVNLFEGIERVDTRFSYPKEAGVILVQAIVEIEVTYRSMWQPLTPHDFRQVVVYAEPTRLVTCVFCGTQNHVPSAFPGVGPSPCCSTCNAALPHPNEPTLTVIDLPQETCS